MTYVDTWKYINAFRSSELDMVQPVVHLNFNGVFKQCFASARIHKTCSARRTRDDVWYVERAKALSPALGGLSEMSGQPVTLIGCEQNRGQPVTQIFRAFLSANEA